MTAERCGLGSLLPVSCRGRAEAFARRLQSRLRSLGRGEGSEEEGASGEEQLLGGGWSSEDGASGGWGAAGCSTHNKQPVVSPDTAPDRFFDFDLQEESAPGSPLTEEIGVNRNDGLVVTPVLCPTVPCSCESSRLQCHCSCRESGCFISSPQSGVGEIEDSSSEDGLQYYEPAWDEFLPSTSETSQFSTVKHERIVEEVEEEQEDSRFLYGNHESDLERLLDNECYVNDTAIHDDEAVPNNVYTTVKHIIDSDQESIRNLEELGESSHQNDCTTYLFNENIEYLSQETFEHDLQHKELRRNEDLEHDLDQVEDLKCEQKNDKSLKNDLDESLNEGLQGKNEEIYYFHHSEDAQQKLEETVIRPQEEEEIPENNDDLRYRFNESQDTIVNSSAIEERQNEETVEELEENETELRHHLETIRQNVEQIEEISHELDELRFQNNFEELVIEDLDELENTGLEIRDCVEKLCNDIISQSEIEVAVINSSDSSPQVVISRAESTETENPESSEKEDHKDICDEEEPHFVKDREQINTLFNTLIVKEHSTSGSSSQVSTPDDERPRRVQRSSSLKSGKTPPSTPGRKKIVRFADVLGLDLADVRTYLDEVPKVPSCAFWDLDIEKKTNSQHQNIPAKCLVPMFQQPVSSPDFLDKVRCNKVCLENAFQGDSLSISGIIRVLNMDFQKSVYLRYSLDCWENFADFQCSYVQGSSDGFSDKFSFLLYAHTLDVGQRVEFAIRYHTAGQQFWDSNGGVNYSFQCLNSTISTVQCGSEFSVHPSNSSPDNDGWASFY